MDLLVTDPATGRRTGLATTIRRALRAMELLYLYSNQPKHLGDFAAIVTSGLADMGIAERELAAIHPEMLGEWKKRVPRPPRRKRER